MPRDDAVVLHLHIEVADAKREDLLAFLRRAKTYYESPGGIRMRLFERFDEADAARREAVQMIEVFGYETIEDYEADDARVKNDPQMLALLAEWRALLEGPPRVEVYRSLDV